MRTYHRTHPWIIYRFQAADLSPSAWLLLGKVSALCEDLRDMAMPAEEGRLLDYTTLLRGVLSNAALDGNGLSEEQVDQLFEGTLELPATQHYLQLEIEGLVRAIRQIHDRQIVSRPTLDAATIQLIHGLVLKGLPWSEDVRPGEYRSPQHSLSADDGVPPTDIPAAIERLCAWLPSDEFGPLEGPDAMAAGILRALMAHLYLQWIRPFDEGNGRTARLVEHLLLIRAGVPAAAAHQFCIQAATTRNAYFRELRQGAQTKDPTAFLEAQLHGTAHALRQLLRQVQQTQHEELWQAHLDRTLGPNESAQGARLLLLTRGLQAQEEAVLPGRIPLLGPDLARTYSRMNPKTLQRDLILLETKGLAERTPEGVRPVKGSLLPFQRTILAGNA